MSVIIGLLCTILFFSLLWVLITIIFKILKELILSKLFWLTILFLILM